MSGDGGTHIVEAERVVIVGVKSHHPAVRRAEIQGVVPLPHQPGRYVVPQIALVLKPAVGLIFLIGLLSSIQDIDPSSCGQHIEILVIHAIGILQVRLGQQLLFHIVASLLGVLFPGQVGGGNGVNAQSG